MKKLFLFPRIFRKKKVIFALIVIILISVFFFIRSKNSARDIKQTQATRQDIREEILLSGEVDADEKANISFQTTGKLSWVGIREGETVQKNQTLATLDSRDVQKMLQKDLNDYMKVRWDFDQLIADNPDKAIYSDRVKRIVEKAQFDLNNSVLDVEIQALAKELSILSSPISGIVTRIDTPHAGINTKITDTIEVINPDTLFFRVSADQTEVTKLASGMKGAIVFDSYSDETVVGTIQDISFIPNANETGTVYDIKVTLDSVNNSSLKYRIGMSGDITFILKEEKNVLALPTEYIKSDEKGSYVLTGKKRIKKYITTGLEGEDYTEIIKGLAESEVVYD